MKRRKVLAICIALLFTGLAACTEDEVSNEQATEAAAEVRETPHTDLVLSDLTTWLDRTASERAEATRIRDLLKKSDDDLEALGLGHVALLRSLYKVREHRPAWVAGNGAEFAYTTEGSSLRETLLKAEPEHALYREDVHVPTIVALEKEATEAGLAELPAVALTEEEAKAVRAIARERGFESAQEVARFLAGDSSPVPRLSSMVAERTSALKFQATARARLELFMSDALVTYGRQMRWSNTAWHREMKWPVHLDEENEERELKGKELALARELLVAERALMPVFAGVTPVGKFLKSLEPPFEQYGRLKGAFQLYSKLVEEGGWPVVPPEVGELGVGSESKVVTTLKERLAAEGYWQGDRTPTFTRSLRTALVEYQRTHQLWESGKLSKETISSLNVTAERRRDQIRLTLQRWRESKVGESDYYVHVNIPDFHLEVWQNGERAMRFRVVTGSTKRKWNDKKGEAEFATATPKISSEIEHLVFNPYWNIPNGIRKEELEPKLAEDPFYYMEMGYETVTDNGREYVRQKPGEKNALGRVKFLFENEHDVYLHDTPDKEYFKWPTRAFSHGCVRLQKPMEFAQFLLEQEGRWEPEKIDAFYEKEGETWLKLRKAVPVHIEYFVVRVDDLGRANFLMDPYHRDKNRLVDVTKRLEEREPFELKAPVDEPETAPVSVGQ